MNISDYNTVKDTPSRTVNTHDPANVIYRTAKLHYARAALGIMLTVPVLLMAGLAVNAHGLTYGIGWAAVAGIVVGLTLELTAIILGIVGLARGLPLRVIGTLQLLATFVGSILAAIFTLCTGVWWLFGVFICSWEWGACQTDLWLLFYPFALWGLVMLTYSFRGLGWSILTWRYWRLAPEGP